MTPTAGPMGSERARETVRRLQDGITSGRWPINSKIPAEAELASELGVGRSTVREAVRSLAHLGMLEPAPGRGTFVRALSPVHGVLSDFVSGHEWVDLLRVRRAIEVEAAQQAAVRVVEADLDRLRTAHAADTCSLDHSERGHTPGQFHGLVVEMAGNRLLAELYTVIIARLRTGVRDGDVLPGQDAQSRRADHAALLSALTARSAAAAAAVAGDHADRDFYVLR